MNLFTSFKNKPEKPAFARDDFDKQLVKNLQSKKLPSLAQLRYLKKFLNRGEKLALSAAVVAIILAVIGWLGYFIFTHRVVLPQKGGEYIEAMVGQPKLINPLFASANEVDADLVTLIYAGLFKYEKNQKLIPEMASGYTLSEDNLVYTVKLRQDLTWSDGYPITANDIIFTLGTIQLPEVNSPLFPSLQGVKMEKINDYEIRFVLTEPFAAFLNTLTVGILPEHVWNAMEPGNLRLAKENLQPKVVSGAWKFAKMIKNGTEIQSLTLEKNDKYHGAAAYLEKLTFKFFYSYNEAYEALRLGDALAASFLPRDLQDKLNPDKLINHKLHLPQYTALFFNPGQNSRLKDADFKTALTQAINKDEILKTALGGDGEIVHSPILPGNVGYYPDIAKINYDAVQANKTLDEDWERIEPEKYFELQTEKIMKETEEELKALPDYDTASGTLREEKRLEVEELVRQGMRPDQFFYRKNNKDEILSLTITTVENVEYQKVAETIARFWRDIGIQTNIQVISGKQINRVAIKERSYEILLYGEILGNDPDPYPFWHSSQANYPGLNLSMFTDRNADKYLEEARITNDAAARGDLYKKFQDILTKEVPAVFLYTPTYNFTASRELQGVGVDRIVNPSDRYNDLKNWYIKTHWGWK